MSQSSTNSSGLSLPSDGPSPRPSLYDASISTVEFMPQLFADIHAPVQPGNYPVVTLTYGGGYSALSRTQLSPLAEYLASRGVVAINADYQPLSKGRHLLDLLHEVVCIASAAPLLAQPHLTYPAGPVWMLAFLPGLTSWPWRPSREISFLNLALKNQRDCRHDRLGWAL